MGDFNQDGYLDLAIVNTTSHNFSVLLGNGDGTFQERVDYPTAVFPYSVAAGDFNGDGILDLATVGSGQNAVQVWMGLGDGTFSRDAIEFEVGEGSHFVVAGDLTGNGQIDLVVANSTSSDVSLLYNNTKNQ